jgi:hypothetical protein
MRVGMRDPLQVWRTCRSIPEVVYCIELTIKEKEQLEIQLAEVMGQLTKLQDQLQAPRISGQMEAALAVKEKFMRDELERRIQSLQLEWKKERHRLHTQIEELKKEVTTSFLCEPAAKKSPRKIRA